MLTISPQVPIFVHREYVDFRNGIEGLIGVCTRELRKDALSGSVFVFRNRTRTSLKILVYDGQGFWLCQKRLSQGRIRWWPEGEEICLPMAAKELSILLYNGNPEGSRLQEDFKSVTKLHTPKSNEGFTLPRGFTD
jgi:hypothetical protein